MADINDLYPSQKEYEDYFKGQQRRGNARSKAAISPIFTKARDKVTTDILEVLNDRRYLKITDSAKRLKAVKRDPKMKQVEAYIIKAGEASLNALYREQPKHYLEEVPFVCSKLYPWTEELGGCTGTPLTDAQASKLRNRPFMGATWKEWMKINTDNAIKSWRSAFRSTMAGDIRTATAVSRDVILVQEARKALSTQESRSITTTENAMIEASRKAQLDVEVAIWG